MPRNPTQNECGLQVGGGAHRTGYVLHETYSTPLISCCLMFNPRWGTKLTCRHTHRAPRDLAWLVLPLEPCPWSAGAGGEPGAWPMASAGLSWEAKEGTSLLEGWGWPLAAHEASVSGWVPACRVRDLAGL